VRGNQARIKNADARHPSSTVVTHRRKSASPRPQCVNMRNVMTGVLIILQFKDYQKHVYPVTFMYHILQTKWQVFVDLYEYYFVTALGLQVMSA